MTEREQVIAELLYLKHDCLEGSATDLTLDKAIALLKAQESQATTHEAEWHIFKGRRGATCSYCKYTFDDVYDPENYDYYCRHCGARMVRIRTVKWE